jgi:CBS domain containing-hemolysin-like protein
VTIAGLEFTVVEVKGRRVSKVLVARRPEVQADVAVRGG